MKPLNRFTVTILAWVLFSLGGCNQLEGLEGRYRAEIQEGNQLRLATLELGINGQGTWKAGGDQVPFRWEVSGAEVRLHTREGGTASRYRWGKYHRDDASGNAPAYV